MKKLLSVLLVLELLLSLVGCLPQESFETTQPELISSSQSQTTLPPQTDPPESTLPPQTDPPETTLPPQTDPPEPTLPPQTDPPETTRPPVTEPPTTRPRPTEPPTTEPPTTQPPTTEPPTTEPPTTEPEPYLDPDGSYTTKEDVALYIHLYGRLPDNFITKSQAKKLGWKSGSLERYAPGKCIGGDRFGNREGLLPYGHTYYECDIDTLGSYSGRGAKRIVFSTDGLIYYTGDHYQSFTLLYGEP